MEYKAQETTITIEWETGYIDLNLTEIPTNKRFFTKLLRIMKMGTDENQAENRRAIREFLEYQISSAENEIRICEGVPSDAARVKRLGRYVQMCKDRLEQMEPAPRKAAAQISKDRIAWANMYRYSMECGLSKTEAAAYADSFFPNVRAC